MTRSTILAVLFVTLTALGLTSVASAHYDPVQGRWLERDPVGYRGGPNPYENVRSSPLIFVDPRGLQAQPTTPPTPAPPSVSPPATPPESPIDVGTYVCSDEELGFFRELVKNIIANAHRAASGEEILGALTSDCKNDKCIRTWVHAQHGWTPDSSYGKDVGGGFGGGTCGSGTGFYRKDPNPQPEDGGRAKGGRSLEDLKAAIASKQVRFCKCCVIYIYGCEVSCIGDFVAELSNITGCTIHAGSGKVSTAHLDGTPGTSKDPWRAEKGWDTWKDGKKTNTGQGPKYVTPKAGCP